MNGPQGGTARSLGALLPEIVAPPPGPASRAMAARLRAVERVQHHIEVFGRGRHVRHDLFIECDDPDAVALTIGHVPHTRREEAGVFDL